MISQIQQHIICKHVDFIKKRSLFSFRCKSSFFVQSAEHYVLISDCWSLLVESHTETVFDAEALFRVNMQNSEAFSLRMQNKMIVSTEESTDIRQVSFMLSSSHVCQDVKALTSGKVYQARWNTTMS